MSYSWRRYYPFIGAFVGMAIGGAWVNAGPPMAPPVAPAAPPAPRVAPRAPMRAPVPAPRMSTPKVNTVQKPVVNAVKAAQPSAMHVTDPRITRGVGTLGNGNLNTNGNLNSNSALHGVNSNGTLNANGTVNANGALNANGTTNPNGTMNANGTLNTNGTANANGALNANGTNGTSKINGAGNSNAATNPLNTNSAAGNAINNAASTQAQAGVRGATGTSGTGLSANNAARNAASAANQTPVNQVGLTNNVFPAQLQQQLGLSSGQTSQINQFQNTFNQELTSLSNRYATDPQGTTSLVTQARQQLQQNINSVLTPQQRVNLSQLSGQADPFSGDNAVASPTTNTTANNLLSYGALSTLGGRNGLFPGTAAANGTGGAPATNNNSGNSTGASTQRSNTNAQAATNAASPNAGRQQAGNTSPYSSITNPDVQKSLGLSNQQIIQLQKGQLDYSQQLADLSSRFRTDPQGTMTLYNNTAQQAQQRIVSVLTPAQRQLFSKLTGVADTNSADVSLPQSAPATTSP